MKKRILGTIIILLILLLGIIPSSIVFTLVMTGVALIGLKELIDIKYKKKEITFIKTMSYVFLSLFLLNNIFYKINIEVLIVLPILCLIMPIVFYRDKEKYNVNDAFYFLGIIFFMAFSFMTIINMRVDSIYKCIYIFIISFVTDTYAYIGGRLIGRHKLTISPRKSIEGSTFGIIMGTFIGSMYYYMVIGGSINNIIIISFILTILSEIGDLVFSSIRGYFNKKDYSDLIPGYGGILDRFDSVIFVSLGLLIISILF